MSKTLHIYYRRDDSAGTAGRLRYRLSEHLAGTVIMHECELGPAAVHSAERIRGDIKDTDLVLLVVGRGLSGAADGRGRRRLENPLDIARPRVAAALESGIPVIPVLLDGARLPAARMMPEDLRALHRCKTVTVSQESFDGDVRALLTTICRVLRHERGSGSGTATSVPTTIVARGMVPGRDPMSRQSAFIASRVAGPVKSRRLRRAMIERRDQRVGGAAPFDFFEWFRVYGPLTIYALMVAFFVCLAIRP